tara:strand:+ start:220 stop:393 length:174 start_codon:yes stop_codon:yes gene_type:complete
MIKTHKITQQRLLLKKSNGLVSTFFLLDNKYNKIKDGHNSIGKDYFKIVVCLNENTY